MKMNSLKKVMISILSCFMIVTCNQSFAGVKITQDNPGTQCVELDDEKVVLLENDDEIQYLNPTLDNEVSLLADTEQPTQTETESHRDIHTVNTNANSLVNINKDRMMNMNLGWKFYLGDDSNASNKSFDDSSWTNINVPHDFSIFQNFTSSGEAESGFLPGGTGWYRKSFTLPVESQNKTILIDFDGVYRDAYVYINGTYVGEHHYGYNNFAFDISDLLVCDNVSENVIAVKVVNQLPTSRWYSGSGIYRDVNLIITDKVHIDYNGTAVSTPDIASGSGKVVTTADIVNDNDAQQSITIKNTVYESDRTSISTTTTQTVTVNANSTQSVTLENTVSNPKLWSIDNPNLYYVHTEITDSNGNILDTYNSTFGFRYFSYSSSGMKLNNQLIKLNGVCLHHDQGAAGSAAYYDAMYRQLAIMKDMGVNAIRTSHNPADRQFIEICDEIGLLVIEEIFDGLVDPKNDNSNDFSKYFETAVGANNNLYDSTPTMQYSEYVTRAIVKRDRNSPSIFAWSFGNEIQEGTYWNNVDRYDDICANFITWAKDEDATRIVTSGDNNRGGDSRLVNVINTITNAGGIAGFNYANSISTLSNLASSYGGTYKCIIASETSSHINSRGMYKGQGSATNIDGKYHLTSYDTSSVNWGITAHDSIYNTYQLDNVLGEFVWTGFDYIGEPTPWNGTKVGDSGRGSIPNSSYFGIVETTGFAKDSYYLYRSQWNKDETTLHLVTAWDSDNMINNSGKTPVWIYSNAPVVKLYRTVNGTETHIGTATRHTNTTAAGQVYYTYTTVSNDSSVCDAVSTSGADSLYSIFNVTYADGTISARAFAEDGQTQITDTSGNSFVTTASTSAKLDIYANRTQLKANGQDLMYIEVDVVDSNNQLNTVATNKITFTLEGEGEIVGVDNGDQATVNKYQQTSVLSANKKSANINAYAGKALVIVKSTDKAGTINVNVTSDGLQGGSVTATTSQVLEETPTYTFTKNYNTIFGTPITLENTITKTIGTENVSGTIVWENYSQITSVGSHSISGTATFTDGSTKQVACNLHIIDNVVAMRNVSTVTMVNQVPVLPNKVKGLTADGTLSTFDFDVNWSQMNAGMFNTIGNIVEVNGTATVLGDKTLPVKAYIRVAELISTESSNVGPMAHVSQDIIGSDSLASVNNGVKNPGDNTNERWSNWANRTTSPYATLTFAWDTAQSIQDINIDYYIAGTSQLPDNVVIKYSLNGTDFTEIGYTSVQENVSYTYGARFNYELDQVINPVAISITFTQKGGQASESYCVAVTEVEFNTFVGALQYNNTAALTGITVNEQPIENFDANTLTYEALRISSVNATANDNVAITILPVHENIVRIVTLSEDGSTTKTYEIQDIAVCVHEHTELQNAKEATCLESGYTGDTYCNDCQTIISTGETIEALGHANTEIVGKVKATCTDSGYTGDKVCKDCQETIEQGTAVEALGHDHSVWQVTVVPTATTTGEKQSVCIHSNCNDTITVTLNKLPKLDSLTFNAITEGVTGIEVSTALLDYDIENKDSNYYEIIDHGLIYYSSTKLGTRTLTMSTQGKYRNIVSAYGENNVFSTVMPTSHISENANYTVRAYASYKDEYGRTIHIYSPAVRVSYNGILNSTN